MAFTVLTPQDAGSTFRTVPQRLWKIRSWLFLFREGFGTLRGVVLGPSDSDYKTVREMAADLGLTEVLIRSDQEYETGNYPRGGFTVSVADLENQLREFRGGSRWIYLLEPVHPLSDVYSFNSASWPADDYIIHEIAGPGFDSSSLKRGDETPHESYLIAKDAESIKDGIVAHTMMTPDLYDQTWQRRAQRAMDWLPREDDHLQELSAVAERFAANGLPLLKEAQDGYRPVPLSLLQRVQDSVLRLRTLLPTNDLPGEPFVLSSALSASRLELIHWDIVWPHLKYEGVRRES